MYIHHNEYIYTIIITIIITMIDLYHHHDHYHKKYHHYHHAYHNHHHHHDHHHFHHLTYLPTYYLSYIYEKATIQKNYGLLLSKWNKRELEGNEWMKRSKDTISRLPYQMLPLSAMIQFPR